MVRRGEIRPLILSVLATRPMHGYEVIQELEAQSGGRWRPSAGSIYPSLQQLADEGLVTGQDVDGRRIYTITDDGKAAASREPAPSLGRPRPRHGGDDIGHLARRVAEAAFQVQQGRLRPGGRGGPEAPRRHARQALPPARRRGARALRQPAATPPEPPARSAARPERATMPG